MSGSGDIELSLILPCYNEVEGFEECVARIVTTLEALDCSYEIIFVDDCSRDNTREMIRAAVKQYGEKLRFEFHEINQGRGGAVRTGFKASRGKYVGFIDIDLEVGPETILPCWLALRGGADVAVGWRLYRVYWHSLFRHFLSRIYSGLVRWTLRLPFVDTESGYKFFKRDAALALIEKATHPGWFWDTEVMAYAHAMGLKVREIPCLFQRRRDKTSKVRVVHDTLAYLGALWTFRRKGLLCRRPSSSAAGPNAFGRSVSSRF